LRQRVGVAGEQRQLLGVEQPLAAPVQCQRALEMRHRHVVALRRVVGRRQPGLGARKARARHFPLALDQRDHPLVADFGTDRVAGQALRGREVHQRDLHLRVVGAELRLRLLDHAQRDGHRGSVVVGLEQLPELGVACGARLGGRRIGPARALLRRGRRERQHAEDRSGQQARHGDPQRRSNR
jgi:hypothetical protein